VSTARRDLGAYHESGSVVLDVLGSHVKQHDIPACAEQQIGARHAHVFTSARHRRARALALSVLEHGLASGLEQPMLQTRSQLPSDY
jgi:hypothetical protein